MVFDFSTTAGAEQDQERQRAIDFIRQDLKPADLVTVMATIEGRLEVLQDFTDDRNSLETAITKVHGGDRPETDIFDASRKLRAIEDACGHLSAPRLVGSKGLLYFSSASFPMPGLYIQNAWTNAANTCVRANTSIYPITQANDSLEKLATATGGGVLPPSNNMIQSLSLARDKIGSHYVLGYYSTNVRDDGRYRTVNVETLRDSVRADYQHGYFADTYFWSFRAGRLLQ